VFGIGHGMGIGDQLRGGSVARAGARAFVSSRAAKELRSSSFLPRLGTTPGNTLAGPVAKVVEANRGRAPAHSKVVDAGADPITTGWRQAKAEALEMSQNAAVDRGWAWQSIIGRRATARAHRTAKRLGGRHQWRC
jgi:hypothetical protein